MVGAHLRAVDDQAAVPLLGVSPPQMAYRPTLILAVTMTVHFGASSFHTRVVPDDRLGNRAQVSHMHT